MKGNEIRAGLEELGISKDNVRVLGLLPLVYVAWADGRVQRRERNLIESLAEQRGWLGETGLDVLGGWLAEPPSNEYVTKGLEVLRALADQKRGVGVAVDQDTLRSLVALSRDVAEEAGGVFGIGNDITPEEEKALEEIAHALGLDATSSWRQVADAGAAHDAQRPPGPEGHLLIGVLPEFSKDPLGFMIDAANTHGDVVYLRVAGEHVYMLRKPEHVQHVFQTNGGNYQRGIEYRNLAKLIGESLLTTDGDAWRKLRRIAQPAFHKRHIDGFAKTIGESTAAMLDRWAALDDGTVVDVSSEMMRLTQEIIALLMFNKRLDDSTGALSESVGVVLFHANEAMINPLRIPEVIPTPENLRFKRAIGMLDELIYGLIAERRENPEGAPDDDLLAMLMAARDDETGEGLTDRELRNELLTFFVAGHETTSLALAWTFYALSKHPTLAKRCVAEIDEKLDGARPGVADTKTCTYTNQFIDETMRLWPPVWAVAREAVSDDEIGGYHVPKGTLVFLAPWVTHRDPSIWPNPEGFDPDRFAPEEVAKRHRDAYFPFVAGPHKCIGMGLAMMELQLIVPMVLQKFRLDLESGFEPGLDPQVTLRPKRGMRMHLRRR